MFLLQLPDKFDVNKISLQLQRFTLNLLVLAMVMVPFQGCGRGKKSIPGLENFNAGVLQGHLYIAFLSTTLNLDSGFTLPIPGLDGSTLSATPKIDSRGAVFQFSSPLSTLFGGSDTLPFLGLPDGRAIPDVETGALPRRDLRLGGLDLTLFLSNEVFGIFIPLKFISPQGVKLPWLVSVKIEDERGNVLGKAYAVPANSTKQVSGLLVLIPFVGGATHAETSRWEV